MRRVLVVLVASTVATLFPATPAAAAPPGPGDLLKLVPTGAKVVIAMDLAELRDHPLVRTWLLEHQAQWSGTDGEADAFLHDAGLDPLRDVESMVVAIIPGAGHETGLALFGGRYDPASLTAALGERGAEEVPLAGTMVFRLTDGQHAHRSGKKPLLHATADIVMVGDADSLAAALSGETGASSLAQDEVTAGRLDPNASFWMVADVPSAMREVVGDAHRTRHAPEKMEGVLMASSTVQRVAMSASLGEELAIVGSALADTEENAGLLRDAIKGALAAARLHAQNTAPELVEVLREVKVTVDGTHVRGTALIPVELIEKLAREAHRSRPESDSPKVI